MRVIGFGFIPNIRKIDNKVEEEEGKKEKKKSILQMFRMKQKLITRMKEEIFQNRHLGRFSTELFNCIITTQTDLSPLVSPDATLGSRA